MRIYMRIQYFIERVSMQMITISYRPPITHQRARRDKGQM